MKRLSPRQYEAVSLVLGGATPSDAAEIMGVNRSRVSVHLDKATDRIPGLTIALAITRRLHKTHRP